MHKFMGLNMKPGKEYRRTIGKPFHISGIAIVEGKTAKLYVTIGEKTFLAAKVSKAIPQVSLNLKFSGDDKIMFEIKGDARVSLVGYWLNIDFNKSDERIDIKTKNGKKAEAQAEDDDYKEWKVEDGDYWPLLDEYKSIANVDFGDSELDPLCDVNSILDSDDEEEVAQPKASPSDVISLLDSDDEEEVAQPKAKIAKLSAEIIPMKSVNEQNDADKKDNSDLDSKSGLIDLLDSVDEEKVAQPKAKVAKLSVEIILKKSAKEQNDADKIDNSDLDSKSGLIDLLDKRTNPEAKKEQPKAKDQTPNQQPKAKSQPSELQPMAKDQTSEQQPMAKDQTSEQQPMAKDQTSEQQQPEYGERILTGGVKIFDVVFGKGDEAKPGKNVLIHYVGHLRPTHDVFNSARDRTFLKFALGASKVVKGLSVGVAGMKVGGKRLITCPSNMAFGERGYPPFIPPNSIMHFEVELTAVLPD